MRNMDIAVIRYYLPLSLLLLAIANASDNETSSGDTLREPRVSGRIVKLYSGVKPEPFRCLGEGFQADPINCATFYRCVRERSGKFTVFRYQCAPGTVYDPDVETCNHPRSTRRSECGGMLSPEKPAEEKYPTHVNEIEELNHEVPHPISTIGPFNTEQTTYKQQSTPSWIFSTANHNSPSWTASAITSSPDKVKLTTHYPVLSTSENEYKTTQVPNHSQDDICSSDGFMGDSNNCRKFYRCVGNQRGGFIRYEFSCSETTIWDDDVQGCNHAWAVKRSKCGRQLSDNKLLPQASNDPTVQKTTSETYPTTKGYGYKSDHSVQQQLQISYGSKVSQTQTQISHDKNVIQNQTQVNYGDRINKNDKSEAKQNQTQISHNSAVSQSQTQINYGDKGVQTQLQIDHSKDSSQSQVQIQESTTNHVDDTTKHSQSNNDCSKDGFIGDSNDCKKFYRCVDNGRGSYTKYEYNCGDGTLWDSSISACNHAWAVKDCNSNTQAESSTVKTTQSYTESSKPSQSHQTSTQNNEDNDIDVGYGNSNDEIQSPSSSTTSTKTTTTYTTTAYTTKSPKQETTDCKHSGFIGDPNDCKIFYRCVDNGNGYTKYEFKCGDGTLWDPEIDACNHAWAVKSCQGSTSSGTHESEATTENNNHQPTASSQTTVTLIQVTTQAPGEDYEENIGYGSPSNTPETTIKPTKQPQNNVEQNDCTSSGFMGDTSDCKKFYRCVDDGNGGFIKHEFNCGDGTVWDTSIEACNHEWAVKNCKKSSNTANHETTSQAVSTTPREPPNGSEIDTTTSSSSHTSTSGTTNTVQSNNECTSSGFMGDKNDCKVFYRCVDNGDGTYTQHEFKCGDGTVWDPKIESCNHAWAVTECSGSSNSQSQNEVATRDPITETVHTEHTSSTTVVSSTTTERYTDATNEKCNEEGFFGSNSDCKKFYRCVDDGHGGFTKYDFTCGEGTEWNQNIKACDHANSDGTCKKESSNEQLPLSDEMDSETTKNPVTTSPTDTHTTEASSKPNEDTLLEGKCDSEGFFGEPTDCKKFYRCVDNGEGSYTKYEFTCGEGTAWNNEIQACDHASNVNGCHSSSSVTGQESQSKPDSESTTHFTPTKDPSSTNNTETNQVIENDQCTSEGFFAHPSDCKKFIRCVDNGNNGYTKYEFSCGEGTVWVQDILACDHDNGDETCTSQKQTTKRPQSSSQEGSSTTTENHKDSNVQNEDYESNEPSHDESDECTSEGYFGDKNDCRKFYRCVDNGNNKYTKYNFECGDGTAWDSDIQTCNHISEVKSCSDTNQQSGSSQTTTEKSHTQTEASSNSTQGTTSSSSGSSNGDDVCENEGYYGNSKDCKKFYRCVDNGNGGLTKYDFTCGDGTIWDQDLTTCNHPQDVANPSCKSSQETSDSSSPTGSSNTSTEQTNGSGESSSPQTSDCHGETSEKPAKQNVTCEKEGYYPNPDDCKKFYRCVDWDGDGERFSVYHFECGEGTIWDPALDTCNHEESVYPPRDCSSSQSQSVEGSSTTEESSTKEDSTTDSTTTEQTTTQETTTSEQTTQESTTAEQTTHQSTTSEQTTQQTTTNEQTSHESTTNEQTTQQSTTSEETTTNQSTNEQTTQHTTTEQTTTQETTTNEQTTTNDQTTIKEQTTTEQTTTSEQTTMSDKTTTQESTTSEQTTTAESTEQTSQQGTTTEETTTTTDESNQQTTQDSNTDSTNSQTTTEESTTTENSTEESTSNKECPETDDDQYVLVCPTSFRRHPKYCNMFYQCTEDENTNEANVATFKCPNETIYDESKTQCVEEDKADKKCDGEIANKRRFKRLGLNYKEPIVADKEKQSCPAPGYFSFEKKSECSKGFLKCEKNKKGELNGYVYQCPEGYFFWSISKRCEFISTVRDCKFSSNDWSRRWNIPIETKNVALRF